MAILGHGLYFLGAGIFLGALIWSFSVICRENAALAIVCLFLPLGLPAVMLLWLPRTWKPFTALAVGLGCFVCGMAIVRPGT